MKRRPQLSVTVVGDVCPNGPLEAALLDGEADRYLGPLGPLLTAADLAIGNLELPLCRGGSPIAKVGSNFRAAPELAGVLRQAGFDLLTMANNHILDYGVDGLRETLAVLDAAGLRHCGAELTHGAACAPAWMELQGARVAVLNFAEGEYAQAQDDGPGTARLDPGWPEWCIRQARAEADYVIAVAHVGNEYQPIPSPLTVRHCRRLAEAGADAVIGHHAHIPQSMEVHGGVPIAFCLGNALFGRQWSAAHQAAKPCWYLGLAARLTLAERGASLTLEPFRQRPDLTLAPLSTRGRRSFDVYQQRSAAIVADPARHQRLWEQEARPLFRYWQAEVPAIAQQVAAGGSALYEAGTLLYNLVRCDAHRWVIQTGLRLLYEQRLADDPAAVAELAELQQLLHDSLADD
jgi:poly-gamma-glutamate synthesis protein (capsule biosynthesis protein)